MSFESLGNVGLIAGRHDSADAHTEELTGVGEAGWQQDENGCR
jgi:hypothetical protein